jgi:hypothetical protein
MPDTFNYYDPGTGKIEMGTIGGGGAPDAGGFKFDSLFGPVSKGLGLASGLLEASGMFEQAGQYGASAKQYEKMAAQALEQGFQTGMDIAHEGEQLQGEMMTAFGKSGTLMEGSPLLAMADTGREIERNVLRAIRQGRINQQRMLYAAEQARKAAKESRSGGFGKVLGAFAGPGAEAVYNLFS